MSERPVLIETSLGLMAGILTEPARSASATALIVQGGRSVRYGPNRMWARTARELADRGVAVLRADYPGAGDSDPGPEKLGETVPAFADALGWLIARFPASRRLLIGSCFGGRVAIRLAAERPDVDAIAVLAPLIGQQEPPTLWSRFRRARAKLLGLRRRRRDDPGMLDSLRAVLGRMPVWVFSGEKDGATGDVLAAKRLLGAAGSGVELEILEGAAIHAYGTLGVQEETVGRVVSWGERQARIAAGAPADQPV